ncbi:hypothetical protein BGHDH14_bgh02612 [Blumeria hordei DH14]|uniref:Apc15p protein-domain-containing protein n=1 Tax=Blumeria graminis f. sp. hordei (strain DH14) TaxID=546991 RepID=N1JP97_BLUG1|nr:hypothetical protein BGHDH14_bgh02612 [Blumeria hordei DH14]
MFALPNIAPQDVSSHALSVRRSYTLWYTSSTSPNLPTKDDEEDPASPQLQQQRRSRQSAPNTQLTQLRLAEESIQRKRRNIADYGASWLKPPGVPKSLRQMREEEREMKEHQEVLRREQLAQELAEAEAAAAMMDGLLPAEEGVTGMEDLPDLDDEVPEAEMTRLDSDDDDMEEDQEDFVDADPDADLSGFVVRSRPAVQDHLYRREAIVRDRLLRDDNSIVDEEESSDLLQEEDLIRARLEPEQDESNSGMDLGMDLDDAVPEGNAYEHTDTEQDTSSSETEEEDSVLSSTSVQNNNF